VGEGLDRVIAADHHRPVAGVAVDLCEQPLPGKRRRRLAQRRRRRQQAHEVGRGVDVAAPGGGVGRVLEAGRRDEARQQRLVGVGCVLVREEAVGDAHLVAIRVAGEAKQAGVLRLPAEAADATLAADDVVDDRGAAADPVGLRPRRIEEDLGIGDRFDQAGAEERRGQPLGDDIGLVRDPFQRRRVDGELLQQRAAQLGEGIESTLLAPAEPGDGGRTGAAADWRRVTSGAGVVVEDRAEPAGRRLDAFELLASLAEGGLLSRRQPDQRLPQRRQVAFGTRQGRHMAQLVSVAGRLRASLVRVVASKARAAGAAACRGFMANS